MALFPKEAENSSLFSDLSIKERDELLSLGRVCKLDKGQNIYIYGQEITDFYIICSGTVRLFREDSKGHEKTIDILTSGQTLCDREFFDGLKNHNANCQVVNDTIVMKFPIMWLRESAQKYNAFALNLLSFIAKIANRAEIDAEHQATMSSAQLVACFLKRICVLYNLNPSEFTLPYSKGLIASRLGMEIETFSRTLSLLKDKGVFVSGTIVKFKDLAAIEAYVCSNCSVAEDCATNKTLKQISDSKPSNSMKNNYKK